MQTDRLVLYLMDLFAEHGFNPRTDLGQNLIDLNIIDFIVDEAELTSNDVVLEIGRVPGYDVVSGSDGSCGDFGRTRHEHAHAREPDCSPHENVTLLHQMPSRTRITSIRWFWKRLTVNWRLIQTDD
ncbi:MAG: hypothetical protein R3C02_07155 [Planctomycetaceae bacterium]